MYEFLAFDFASQLKAEVWRERSFVILLLKGKKMASIFSVECSVPSVGSPVWFTLKELTYL